MANTTEGTPESTVWALALSALLMLLAPLVGLTANGAIALWTSGASAAGIRRALRQSAQRTWSHRFPSAISRAKQASARA
jgi:type II secretory pathway component PulL